MVVFAIYDVKNGEQCCGVFERKKQIKEYLNVPYNTICNAVNRGSKIGRRFEICRIEIEE